MMLFRSDLERSIKHREAISKLIGFLESKGFSYELKCSGEEYKTYFCEITDDAGNSSRGIGKGQCEQSIASAIAEAIEHYYYEKDSSRINMKKVSHCNAPDWFFCGAPNFHEIIGTKIITLGHHEFYAIGKNEKVDYPAFLSNPDYEPKSKNEKEDIGKFSLTRYSCNSGIASGLCQSDAELHGLLELIERDSVGMFLLGTVISKKSDSVKVVSKYTLPKDIKKKVTVIENELQGVVEIYEATSNLQVPVFIASLRLDNGERYFGSGASLNPEYAIERSVDEAAQCVHAQRQFNFSRPIEPRNIDTNDLPKYTRCFFDHGIYEPQGKREFVDFDIIQGKYGNILSSLDATEQQLEFLVQHLEKNEIQVFRRSIYSDNGNTDLYVGQVLVPKLERFYLVASGIHVLPASRGQEYLDSLNSSSIKFEVRQ